MKKYICDNTKCKKEYMVAEGGMINGKKTINLENKGEFKEILLRVQKATGGIVYLDLCPACLMAAVVKGELEMELPKDEDCHME